MDLHGKKGCRDRCTPAESDRIAETDGQKRRVGCRGCKKQQAGEIYEQTHHPMALDLRCPENIDRMIKAATENAGFN